MSNLPLGWAVTTIGELAPYIQRGKSPKYTDHSELPVINQKCIRWNKLEIQYLKYIHPDQFSSWDEARYIRRGDILWNSTGTGTVGRAYLVSDTDSVPRKVVDSHVTIVRASCEVDRRYVYSWIKGPTVQHKIEDMCDGTTNQIELSKGAISETEIPLAPLNEQTRIADKLDAVLARVDACRDRLNRVPAILKRFRQAILAAAISGKLTEEWREKSGVTMDEWESTSLGQVVKESANGLSKRQGDSGKEITVLRLADFKNSERVVGNERTIRLVDKELLKYGLSEGDLLVIRVNGSRDLAGKFIAYEKATNNTEAYCDHFIRLRLDVERILPNFALFVANSGVGRDYIETVLVTSAGQNTINQGALFGLSINLPSPKEQTEIVRRVESLFAYADRLDARYAAARAQVERLTPALLAKAFRGELVPQDPNDEPASALLERIRAARAVTPKPQSGRRKESDAEDLPMVAEPRAVYRRRGRG